MIEIKAVLNGWILTDKSDPDLPDQTRVFSYTDEKSEAEAFRDLLCVTKDLIGPMDSRYSENRVYVVIKPGDKHDGFTEEDAKLIWGD